MKLTWKKFNLIESLKKFFGFTAPFYQEVTLAGQRFIFREIALSDIRGLLALEKEVYAGELPWSKTAFVVELKNLAPHRYVLLERGGEIVGFVGARLHAEDCHVTNIAVHPRFQGQGIGSFMLRDIFQYAKENKSQQITLEVRISNLDAQRLYRRFGFVSCNIKKNYYTENNEDAVDMIVKMEDLSW